MRTITMSDLKAKNVEYWSKKDNSVRGICIVPSEELKVGDEVVISNYFTQIIDELQLERIASYLADESGMLFDKNGEKVI